MEYSLTQTDMVFMGRAFELALIMSGKTHPNPSVGALLVSGKKIVGEGFHKGPGKPHAEVEAIKKAGKKSYNSTLYVSLEPCPTYGKTPPCTDLIIKSGIKRVVAGIRDPNPKVNGRGINILKKAGVITIVCGLKKNTESVDPAYFHFYKYNRPYIILKMASTINGMTTPPLNHKYMTSKTSLKVVHEMRAGSDAILTTAKTILYDNSEFTIRHGIKKKPLIRIVLDRNGILSGKENIFTTAKDGSIWIFTAKRDYHLAGIKRLNIIRIGERGKFLDLNMIMEYLTEKRVMKIMVEGGLTLMNSLLVEGLIDEICWFSAMKVGMNKNKLFEHIALKEYSIIPSGNDIMIKGYI